MKRLALVMALMLVAGCSGPARSQAPTPVPMPQDEGPAAVAHATQFKVHSSILNRDYEIYVAEPARAEPGVRAPAVYVLDGDTAFALVASIARRLAQGGEMAPAYVVGIGYGAGPNLRDHDYLHASLDDVPGSGGGAKFEQFLLQEVKPLIEARYPTDPARAVLTGHSFGGLFVANVLVRHPQAFAGWLVSSGSLWVQDEAVVKSAKALSKAGLGKGRKLFVSVGATEGDGMIQPAMDYAKLLGDRASGFQVSSQVWDGESHISVPPIAYTRGLRLLLADTRASAGAD